MHTIYSEFRRSSLEGKMPRFDNIMSRDGSYGYEDVQRAQDEGKASLDHVLNILVQVARGEKGREDVQTWILANYPERLPI